jgi:head-tail adaptor
MISDYFTTTINILSATAAVNDMGDYVQTFATASTVTGLIDLLSGSKANVASQYIEKATHVMFLTYGTSITDQAKIVSGGKTYRVLYVDSNPITRNHHIEVILEYVGVDAL